MNKKDQIELLFDKLLSQSLKEQRETQNLTQTAAAGNFKNHRQWVGKIESGFITPSIYTLYKYTSCNKINLVKVLKETIDRFSVESKPLFRLEEKAKYRSYIEQTKKRNAKGSPKK